MNRRLKLGLGVAAVVVVAAAAIGFWSLRRSVKQALTEPRSNHRILQFVALPEPGDAVTAWGSGDVVSVAAMPSGLIWAGGSGAFEGDRFLSGLPTLSVSAITPWRGVPVVALTSGGFYRRLGGEWEEARTGWGALHVRTLVESEAGELLVGAREGLFRAAFGAAALERLDEHPVRCLALGKGFVLAGGEDGLRRVEAGRVVPLATPDTWVESVALMDENLVVVTAAGLARGPLGGTVVPVSGGEEVISGVLHEGRFLGVDGTSPGLLRLDASGKISEEVLPEVPRRLLSSKASLFADTASGIYARGALGWKLVRPRPPSLPGSAHVSALAHMGPRLVAGIFDGGLVTANEKDDRLAWRAVPGSSAWGVNALLPAGGVLYVASLRGAARFDGATLKPLDGPGAAFSLAATPDGVAIGYGQGVLLPGPRLLSAFHGLPGNQVLALAPDSTSGLFAGTPWGLAALEGGRVRWRVGLGEGALPHPWITALALDQDVLYVGTYGGGVTRRTAARLQEPGRFEPFPETGRLKVSAGCLLVAGGRLYLGTEGAGLLRLSHDRKRFEPVRVALPSPRVTALLASEGALYVGTDEGLVRLPIEEETTATRMASILETKE